MLETASWKTMLPGMMLAGIGLGLTNTPVTNTATSSISNDRAGMASGIDTSARLITLAINIAVMGFVLINGIFNNIRNLVSQGRVDVQQLHQMASKIASGNYILVDKLGISNHNIKIALLRAFGDDLLFGGLGVCLLSACSFYCLGQSTETNIKFNNNKHGTNYFAIKCIGN